MPLDKAQPLMPLTTMTFSPLAEADLRSIRLIATDIDGTLTAGQHFSSQLLIALEKLQAVGLPVLLVTGRSAGWVEGLANYLPVAGAIAENGGCFFSPKGEFQLLGSIKPKELGKHREKLADCFWQLQDSHSQVKESHDNRGRLTDWTFDLEGLDASDLWEIGAQCERWGWDFTYSSIQCHIKLSSQNKASGIQQVLKQQFSGIKASQVLTIGDSPNDAAMFNPEIFPNSVGVANVQEYAERMGQLPAYITQLPEIGGFNEIVDLVLLARQQEPPKSGFDRIAGFIERSLTGDD
jgi:HAD superfamily hydrolase (TIGR01484 family)